MYLIHHVACTAFFLRFPIFPLFFCLYFHIPLSKRVCKRERERWSVSESRRESELAFSTHEQQHEFFSPSEWTRRKRQTAMCLSLMRKYAPLETDIRHAVQRWLASPYFLIYYIIRSVHTYGSAFLFCSAAAAAAWPSILLFSHRVLMSAAGGEVGNKTTKAQFEFFFYLMNVFFSNRPLALSLHKIKCDCGCDGHVIYRKTLQSGQEE